MPRTPDQTPGQFYDQTQAGAVLVTRPCCGRTMYATHPHAGRCARCNPYPAQPREDNAIIAAHRG